MLQVVSVDLDEDFGEGGVDVYGVAELSKRGTEGDVSGHLLNEVCGVRTEDVGAEDASFAGLSADLNHSLGLAYRQRLAVSAIEGFVTFIGRARCFQLIL